MSIMRRRPGSFNLPSLRDEMNRLFDDFSALPHWPGPVRGLLEGEWSPSVDIAEKEDKIVVTAELPGVVQDDVDVSITNNVLTVKGEKKEDKEVKEDNYHRMERIYGSFHRSIPLPTNVQGDKAEASYNNGVLRIIVPKSEEVKSRQIKISVD